MLSKILRYKEERLIMSFKIYFILFMLYSIFGWICEEIVTFDPKKGFINRGFLLGPYCPIYGFSAIFMTILLNKFSNSLAIFSLALIICSTVEYLSSYVMEKLFNARWWDYSKKPFNINGRICLKNALCFGVMGLILIKVVDPYLRTLILRFSPFKISFTFYVMLITFILDNILSYKLIFKIKSENTFKKRDNTREISKIGKEILSKLTYLFADPLAQRYIFSQDSIPTKLYYLFFLFINPHVILLNIDSSDIRMGCTPISGLYAPPPCS